MNRHAKNVHQERNIDIKNSPFIFDSSTEYDICDTVGVDDVSKCTSYQQAKASVPNHDYNSEITNIEINGSTAYKHLSGVEPSIE